MNQKLFFQKTNADYLSNILASNIRGAKNCLLASCVDETQHHDARGLPCQAGTTLSTLDYCLFADLIVTHFIQRKQPRYHKHQLSRNNMFLRKWIL